jgi:hypothetical protein
MTQDLNLMHPPDRVFPQAIKVKKLTGTDHQKNESIN